MELVLEFITKRIENSFYDELSFSKIIIPDLQRKLEEKGYELIGKQEPSLSSDGKYTYITFRIKPKTPKPGSFPIFRTES